MNKPIKPEITIPQSFAENGVKTDFDDTLLADGFDNLRPDVLAGDNLNKFIDDTYKGLNYGMAAADAINLIKEGETLTVEDGKLVSGASGGGLEVGDIGIAPLGIDENQNKRRYLNGQIIMQQQFVSFTKKLKTAKDLYPSLTCTEDEWQTTATMTIGGQVGKFVIDDEQGTIRLPKIIMPIQGLTDLSKLAEIVEAGLPNITGSIRAYVDLGAEGQDDANEALYTERTGVYYTGTQGAGGATDRNRLSLDASRSNPIYGNSTTVQQEQIRYPYFIQVATGVEKTEDVDRDIVLNNPFFFGMYQWFDVEPNNASWLISNGTFHEKIIYSDYYDWLLRIYNGTETQNGVSVKLHTEAYSDEDFVINQENETFRLPIKVKQAFFYSQNIPVVGNGVALGLTDGSKNYGVYSSTSHALVGAETAYGTLVPSNASNSSYIPTDNRVGITTDPTKSGIEAQLSNAERTDLKLYFYVGAVNQDAPLINSGRALEILPKKLDKSQLYNKMTNCITEIPQRIKLELNDGVLTLKAGSEVIVPNGFEDDGVTPKFDYVKNEEDKICKGFEAGKCSILINANNDLYSTIREEYHGSGTAEPSGFVGIFYNTTLNKVGYRADATKSFTYGYALPLGWATNISTTECSSIDQVFNCMGYIGSTVWVDKGVKCLIPDGRNQDGTLKNIEYTYDQLWVRTMAQSGEQSNSLFKLIYKDSSNVTHYVGTWGGIVINSTTKPTPISNQYILWYNPVTNQYMQSDTGGEFYNMHACYLGVCNKAPTGNITDLIIRKPFRAVDYQEASGLGMPSSKYIDLTLGASDTHYTAPANGFVIFEKACTGNNQFIQLMNKSPSRDDLIGMSTVFGTGSGASIAVYLPVKRGDIFKVAFNAGGALGFLRFIYAEGEI